MNGLLFATLFSGFLDLHATPDDRQFNIALAQVQWSRVATKEEPVGFTLSLIAGDGADFVHSGEPDDTFRNVYQASVAYRVNDALALEGGIYPSHIGLESFHSKDDWNYTRSHLADLSPYYQAGVKATYAINDRWSAQLHVLNGFQLIHNEGNEHGYGTQLAYSGKSITASFNTYVDADRHFGDVVVVARVTPHLQLGAVADYGTRAAGWRGVTAYARYAFSDRKALALRAEHVTGTTNVNAATLTYELRPREPLILKFELRDDDPGDFRALVGAVVTF